MPTYTFKCPRCGDVKDFSMTISEYETVEKILCGNCLQDDVDSVRVRVYTPLAFKFVGGKPSARG